MYMHPHIFKHIYVSVYKTYLYLIVDRWLIHALLFMCVWIYPIYPNAAHAINFTVKLIGFSPSNAQSSREQVQRGPHIQRGPAEKGVHFLAIIGQYSGLSFLGNYTRWCIYHCFPSDLIGQYLSISFLIQYIA